MGQARLNRRVDHLPEMDSTADLDAALGFVIGRIEEQAMRSGEPLNSDERFLLNNLPRHSDAPEFTTGDPEYSLTFILRDTTYERLCAVAKAAYRNDLELNPGSRDWEFAFNVSKLSRHPMCWLLQWAGLKQRRPWWDRWLLTVAALLFVIAAMALTSLVIEQPWAWWRWTAVVAGYVSVLFLMYVATRRIEERQLERNIQRCRNASRFASSLTR
jgi:hypothetical protein